MRRVAAAVMVVMVLTAGCAGGGGASSSAGPDPTAGMTAKQRYHAAAPVVRTYLTRLAANDVLTAGRIADVTSRWQDQQTLAKLRTWLERIPIGQLRLTEKPYRRTEPGTTGVLVTMSARLKPAPLSQWVQLGRRVITARWADGGWKVVADETARKGVKVQQIGLSLFPEPSVLSGKHVSVVSEELEAGEDAREILADADDFVPSLDRAYGEGAAAQHPVIFLVRNVKQGEQLSGVKNFRKEVPQGFVLNATAYIEWPQWGTSSTLERDGVIAHELTHVASWQFLGRSPHSMLEGLAMYHEDRFVRQFGYLYPLRNISAAYRSGQFPSIELWQRRMTDWGLKDPAAVDLCYEDAQAMVAVILTKHGGAAGLGRLARAFTAYHLKGLVYSQQQVRDAFAHGLGVSFDQVVAEAHAYAAAHAG